MKKPSQCPVCGAAVPAMARACPDCGADERAGWNEEETRYDDLGLPDEAFLDPGQEKKKRPKPRKVVNGMPFFWWAIGVVLLGGTLYFVLRPIF